ncbi:MAG: hypothetical protein ACKO6N_21070 [Myxococcota bacterium]
MQKLWKNVVFGVGVMGLVSLTVPAGACEMSKKAEKGSTTTSAVEKNKGDAGAKGEQKSEKSEKKPNT